MCGIVGIIDFKIACDESVLASMVRELDHRGPDSHGHSIQNVSSCSVGLGHSRLAIIDLSPMGHQPMTFDGSHIVFNGEIYNYRVIKKELQSLGHKFISQSDTEVILHAYREWGLEKMISKLIGMFSFILLDVKEHTVYLVRDRLGVKPLYYFKENHTWLISSELKSLVKHPSFTRKIDYASIKYYFSHGFISSPYSIYQNCRKLKAGHYLSLDLRTNSYQERLYWSVESHIPRTSIWKTYGEAKERLKSLLISAVNYRMIADVPVGVMLSGGFDSAAVISILQSNSSENIDTFTIGFRQGNDESQSAKAIAQYLGTNHHEYHCTEKEAKSIIPSLPYFYDEPFADSSCIPTMLVSRIARQHVKVAMSADGGDELFGGYNRYRRLLKMNSLLNRFPNPIKGPIADANKWLLNNAYDTNSTRLDKLRKVFRSLDRSTTRQISNLYSSMNELPTSIDRHLYNFHIQSYPDGYNYNAETTLDDLSMLLVTDTNEYLQNDILTKVDRATMSVSLEGREPLLDHRLFEFAATLNSEFKINSDKSKRILKDIVYDYLPKEMMDRPKTGFSVPINSWLRGDLGYLLDEFCSEEKLEKTGLLNTPYVTLQISKFRSGKLHFLPIIWRLLMFQMWVDLWKPSV